MTTSQSPWKSKKFRLFHRISSMLRDAPHPVRRAWQEGWTNIKHFPNGYDDPDWYHPVSYPAGWYGMCPVSVRMGNTLITGISEWQFICGPNGEEPYYVRKAPEEQPTTGSCDFEIEIGTGRFRVG